MKRKLVFYTNQLKKRWNVVEPGGLIHNPRAKRVRTEVPAAHPFMTVVKTVIIVGVVLYALSRFDLVSIFSPQPHSRETAESAPQAQDVGSRQDLQGERINQPRVPPTEPPQQAIPTAGSFYTYTDNQGVVHMVDNLAKVPQEYRPGMKVTEPAVSRGGSTPVIIRGNQVIVPAIIAYRGKSVAVRLLLDTGASITTINENVAARLGVSTDSVKTGTSTVADGRSVSSYRFRADSVIVDDHAVSSPETSILPGSGGQGYEGLLGMNFLKDFRYHINFDQRVIEWGG
jgi:predicted aspartyl protease